MSAVPSTIPHLTIANFLGERLSGELLQFAYSRLPFAESTTIGQQHTRVNTAVRHSHHLGDLDTLRPEFERRILDRLAEMRSGLGVSDFTPAKLQTEMVAHGDGAFYKRHIDTAVGLAGLPARRALTTVYYFHREPKAFSGGALRLFSLFGPEQFVDVSPEFDLLVAFPSFLPHEVMPVTCRTNDMRDSRFAVNCWVYQPTGAGSPPPATKV